MPEMVKHGLAGEKVRRRVALLLNGASILSFLLVWTLASTVVAVYSLINPTFLPSSWIVFQIEGVSKWFDTATHAMPALLDVTLDVCADEFVCLLGPSGYGKSTLLNIAAGFIPPSKGRGLADGKVISDPGSDRGVVFQEYALFPWLTVWQNVEFGPKPKGLPSLNASCWLNGI
jgi:hypothetical protein